METKKTTLVATHFIEDKSGKMLRRNLLINVSESTHGTITCRLPDSSRYNNTC